MCVLREPIMTRLSPRAHVLQWLESAIASGELPRGAAIPSERLLAEQLGVSRNTVSTAMDIAEKRRLIAPKTPASRKRFVTASIPVASPLSAATVVVLSEQSPYTPEGQENAPRWSNRYLSIELLARLSAAGKHVMLLNTESLSDQDVQDLFTTRFAGMAILGTISEHPRAGLALSLCRERAIPAVTYGNYEALFAYDRVYSDHRLGSRDLTRWLLAKGCRNPHVFYPAEVDSLSWVRRRYEGYCDAMREAGLAPHPYISYGSYERLAISEEDRFRIHRALAVESLLALQRQGVPFDALLCITDHWAKAIVSALRNLGLRPNQDVLVAGYDNIQPDPEFDPFETTGAIVTIDKHNERIAGEMAALLLDRMAGRLPDAPQSRTNPFELIVRN